MLVHTRSVLLLEADSHATDAYLCSLNCLSQSLQGLLQLDIAVCFVR